MVGRDITIGQYLAEETPLHRVDPRLKLLVVIAGTVLVFLYGNGWALLAFSGMLLAVLVAVRLPLLRVLKSVRTVWVIIIITALLQFFLTPGQEIFRWGFIKITDAGLSNGILLSSRVLVLVIMLAALTMTTAPLRLADGLEFVLRPLEYLRVPVGRVTTVVSITLMFIPNILDMSHKVIRAQMARGADFESANIFRRVKDIIPVLVPLFVKVFHDADDLACAMDARAYAGGEGRTRLYPLKMKAPETILALAFIAAAIGIVFIF